ncbi:MAG TPA: glycosyl hydrolase family 28 protein [Ferruginibacter sp.]|nr:glycosyl hydrolase family 28 protein [Ferruginibacter sp.]HMP20552.1 glycosyl hydrolase family 28 protein [Ferruginibacter sp.]
MKKYIAIAALVVSGFAFLQPDRKPVLFLAGDSTMADKPLEGNPERGWGQYLPKYLNDDILVENHAVNGRSTKSFIALNHWEKLITRVQQGDFVMIQFGHNDSKQDDSTRYAPAATLYKDNLVRMVNEVKAKGATPILLTPVMRRKFDAQGKFVDQHGEYPDVVRAVAKTLNVQLIDLHQLSKELIEKEGVENSKRLFLHIPANHFKNYTGKKEEDNTHFSEYGATAVASLVCSAINSQDAGLKKFLKASPFKNKYSYELPKIYVPHFRLDTVNILDFGAVADGYTLNSAAINKAIETCAAKGGGTVLVPRGSFVTGPIIMKSNINLHLAKGALVIFSPDFNQYPLVVSSFEGVDAARCQSPVTAENLENIAITGEGIFDGNGFYWRPLKKDKMSESQWKNHQKKYGGVLTEDKKTWYSSVKALKGLKDNNIGKLKPGQPLSDFEDVKDFLRPNMIRIYQCKNVLIKGVTFENAPAWTTHCMMSEHITLKGLKVKNPWYGTNTDALDLESCSNALVEDCVFDTGDDGICIKSGRDEEGRKRGMPTKDVIVNNCTVYHSHGGFVVGSEMSGGANNLFVSNCNFIGSDIGLRFKTTRGRGGIVENIYIDNVNMLDIPAEAILFDMYYAAKDPVAMSGEKREPPKVEFKPVDETTPRFRNIHISNVTCNGASKGIFVRGIPEMHIENIHIENATLQANEGIDIQEATGINLKNILLVTKKSNPLVYVLNSDKIRLDNIRYRDSAELLLQVQGDRSRDILFLNSNTEGAKQKLAADYGAAPAVVSWLEQPVAPAPQAKKKKKKNSR